VRTLRRIGVLLLAGALLAAAPALAQQGEAGFVRLVVNDGAPVEVFPVWVAGGERPYLQFDALMRAIEMPAAFDPSLGAALGFLPDGTTRFDLNLQRGTVLVGETTYPLEPEHYRLVDQTLYVLYSELPRWLPLKLDWSVQAYQVRIRTDYPLPSTQREQREARRRALAQVRAEAPTAAQLEHEVPWFDPGMFEFHGTARGGEGNPEELLLNLKGVQRFLKGDLEYSLTEAHSDGTTRPLHVDYGRLTYYDPLHTWQVQLGDTFSGFSPLLLDPLSFRGFSFYTGGQQLRFGRTQLIGTAPPGSEVDLYRQGVLLDFTSADAQGFYRFANVPLALDANLFEIRIFTPEGRTQVEFRQVAAQEEMLSQGAVATLGGAGRGDQGLGSFGIGGAEVRYGVLPSLTLGAYALQLSDYLALYETIDQLNAAGAFALWRPLSWLVLLGEHAQDASVAGGGNRLGAFFAFQPVALELEQRRYSGAFAPPNRTRSSDFSVADRADVINAIQARTRLLDANLELHLERSDFGQERSQDNERLRVDRRITAQLSAYATVERQRSGEPGFPSGGFDEQQLLSSYRLGPLERLEAFALRRHALILGSHSELRGSWLKTGQAGSPWSWELSYVARSPEDDLAVAALGYLFANNLRASGYVHSDGTWLLQLEYILPFRATGQGLERLPEGTYGRAGLQGDVYVDANANGVRDAGEAGLGGVHLLAPGMPQLQSDPDGHVRGWGLPAGAPVAVDVDLLTADALYTPAQKHNWVSPRPGELLNMQIALVPSSGMDGLLVSPGKAEVSPAEGLELLLRRGDGQVEARARVEWDGAFIFEHVAPGVYTLEADPHFAEQGLKLDPERLEVTFPPGPDPAWRSGVQVRLVRSSAAAAKP
jgi:hypothetical protein